MQQNWLFKIEKKVAGKAWIWIGKANFIQPISSLPRYLLASFYTKYDAAHFLINTASLLSVLLPKLPQFHGVRLFGINKY